MRARRRVGLSPFTVVGCGWFVLSSFAAVLPAAGPPAIESLFPRQIALSTEGGQLARAFLPLAVVIACRGDLSDIRIVDGGGREVPYIIDSGLPLGASVEKRSTIELSIESVERSRQDREEAPSQWTETYELSAADGVVLEGGEWELIVVTRESEFARAVQLYDTDDQLVGEGLIFRLTDPLREKTRVPLPVAVDRAALRITIEGEDEGGYLEPVFRLERTSEIAAPSSNEFELKLLSVRSVDGRSLVELDRPHGLIPDQLRVASSTPIFNRRFEVWDEGPASQDRSLAEGTLIRLSPESSSETPAQELELPLRRATGDRLRVVIEDGDSPPLETLSFTAVVRRPAILFSLPKGESSAVLLYGGGRAHRPRYDISALRPKFPSSGQAGEVSEKLVDPGQLASVTFGNIEPNPKFDAAPALAFAMRSGREIDPERYSHATTLMAPASKDGLVRFELSLETLATARADLADVRVVDAENRQWPYLVSRDVGFATVPLTLEQTEIEEGRSIYSFALPASPLPVRELFIDPPATFFERRFTLEGENPERGGRWRQLATGTLSRRQGDRRKSYVSANGAASTSLRLTVDDHQDAPLELGTVELRYARTELYFAAPAGDYRLLVGDPEATPPRYELASVRDVVLAVDAATAQTGVLESNKDYSATARLAGGKGAQSVLLWVVLGLAVVVLGWFTLRLAREES